MTTYSKTQLISDVATNLGLSKTGVQQVIDAAFATITEKAAAGETVAIAGFGRFQVKTRAARTARNPSTGEAVAVPEKQQMKFTPTKTKP